MTRLRGTGGRRFLRNALQLLVSRFRGINRRNVLIHHQLEMDRAAPLESVMEYVVRPGFALDVNQYAS